jgi:hypothetical protein
MFRTARFDVYVFLWVDIHYPRPHPAVSYALLDYSFHSFSSIFRHVKSGPGDTETLAILTRQFSSCIGQDKWLPTLRTLVAKINETFGHNFREMAVAGEVSLGKIPLSQEHHGLWFTAMVWVHYRVSKMLIKGFSYAYRSLTFQFFSFHHP